MDPHLITSIAHMENREGRLTEVCYSDPEDGLPMAARIPGWLDMETCRRYIMACRQGDRNRRPQ
jgi:hypothetical protein